jgi:hypothetical protein
MAAGGGCIPDAVQIGTGLGLAGFVAAMSGPISVAMAIWFLVWRSRKTGEVASIDDAERVIGAARGRDGDGNKGKGGGTKKV